MLKRLLKELSHRVRTSLNESFVAIGDVKTHPFEVCPPAPKIPASRIILGYMSVDKRNGGCGVIFEDKLYVWGGQTLDIDEPEDRPDGGPAQRPVEIITSLPRPEDDYPFDILDLTHMVWSQETTSARHEDREDEEIPDVGLGSSLVVYPETKCFLLFGGLNELHFDNKVYRIFPGEWMWDRIEPSSDVVPTPRYITGVIIHNNRLCVFGGVSGPIREGADKGARYAPSHNAEGVKLMYGWNNEYFEMDLETSEFKCFTRTCTEEYLEGPKCIPYYKLPLVLFGMVNRRGFY